MRETIDLAWQGLGGLEEGLDGGRRHDDGPHPVREPHEEAPRGGRARREGGLGDLDGDPQGAAPRIHIRDNEGVVVSGNLPSKDGKYSLYCAVIVKRVDERTRSKVGINELLRDI